MWAGNLPLDVLSKVLTQPLEPEVWGDEPYLSWQAAQLLIRQAQTFTFHLRLL